MRRGAIAVTLLFAACTAQQAAAPVPTAAPAPTTALSTASPTPRICSLPVWWGDGSDVHAAFVSVPDGAVTDAGILPALPQAGGAQLGGAYGGTFSMATRSWLRIDRRMLSPDSTRYAYWTGNPSQNEIHLVDVATGADRTIYSGPTLYIVLSFEADAIYVVHAINPRQGAFEKLYRLDPAGGTPVLVPGSDRHMYQWGWVLIADGAAWGVDVSSQGNEYTYSVERLDLATAQVTQWFTHLNDLAWPLGADANHRLYVQGVLENLLWRLTSPGRADDLPNPGPISLGDSIGGPDGFASDPQGAWFGGRGGVWFYSDRSAPKQFAAGPPGGDVWPAGPCLLLPP